METTTSSGRTRISEKRSSLPQDPADHPVVHPLQIELTDILDPDPEVVEDPPVRVPLPASGPQVPELVQEEADHEAVRKLAGHGEGADRVLLVERVHEGAEAGLPLVVLPEAHDLRAVQDQPRPGKGLLPAGHESLDDPKRQLEFRRPGFTGGES
jgi:hypothetical protein